MTRWICSWTLIVVALLTAPPSATASEIAIQQPFFTLQGKVLDRENRAVGGAEIAVYRTGNVRRPVDFMVATDTDGSYRLEIPSGRYWVVARHRKSAGFGPLLPTDRHSGNPVETTGENGEAVSIDFMISGIRDAVKPKEPTAEGLITVTGTITAPGGLPVGNAYVHASRTPTVQEIPDFISAWTDSSGEYSLSLPPGRYFIGAAREFPPLPGAKLVERTFSGDQIDIVVCVELPL